MSEADKSGLIIFLLIFVLPCASFGLYLLGLYLWSRSTEKAQRYLEHEKARVAAGLPAHERCLCAECAKWRRHIDTARGYERGLR